MFSWIKDVATGRCANCRTAQIFETFWRMHAVCPECGVRHERESGYFSMSIFVGYVLAIVLAVPFVLLTFLLGLSGWWFVVLPSVVIVLAAPWIFRYARILWIYIDEWMDPRRPEEKNL